jgi:hypothetical protein
MQLARAISAAAAKQLFTKNKINKVLCFVIKTMSQPKYALEISIETMQ